MNAELYKEMVEDAAVYADMTTAELHEHIVNLVNLRDSGEQVPAWAAASLVVAVNELHGRALAMHATMATATRMAEVYQAIISGPLCWIDLTHIRGELAGVSHDEQDAALVWIAKGNVVTVKGTRLTGVLAPDSSRARNRPENVAAAITIGATVANWICFEDAE